MDWRRVLPALPAKPNSWLLRRVIAKAAVLYFDFAVTDFIFTILPSFDLK
jgi:hypothetical protein